MATLAGCGQDAPQGPPTFRFGQLARVPVLVDGGRIPIQATVRVIEQGSRVALESAGLALPAVGVPFYVRVGYANPTGRAFTAPVAQRFFPRQSDGAYAQRLDIVSGTPFAPCADVTPPIGFGTLGGTADSCIVVLAAPGTTVTSVGWAFADGTTYAVWRP